MHMRAFIYSICHVYYRWTRAYAWNGTYLKMKWCTRALRMLSGTHP